MPPDRTGTPYLSWHDPREVIRSGSTHTYQSSGDDTPALSVLTELTVRCEDGSFVWNKEGGAPVTHRIDDPVGAVRSIAARSRPQGPSRSPIDSACEPTV
jgi:hypothetical protein